MKTIGYVIISTRSVDQVEYYAIDYESNGYGYWSININSAKVFQTPFEAERVLKSSEFTKEDEMNDGVIYPPRMIHSASGVCKTKITGRAEISICAVNINVISSKVYPAVIKNG